MSALEGHSVSEHQHPMNADGPMRFRCTCGVLMFSPYMLSLRGYDHDQARQVMQRHAETGRDDA